MTITKQPHAGSTFPNRPASVRSGGHFSPLAPEPGWTGLGGLRWGELAGLQVGDVIRVPGAGLRLQRAVIASTDGGGLFVESLKSHRARTVPLVSSVVPVVERWAEGKAARDWLFSAPEGGPLAEQNWKRSINWTDAKNAVELPNLRVYDLRHTAASVWLGAGADPKVVQRILGHASAAMTMDLYGHLIDQNLWDAAKRVDGAGGDHTGTAHDERDEATADNGSESGA